MGSGLRRGREPGIAEGKEVNRKQLI